jgi:type IX secretion system PorP/SprF family membrane protein
MPSCIKYNIKERELKLLLALLQALILLFIQNIDLQAQDIHFSQFFAAPLLTNPANTGMSGEDLRIANIYRNQWAKIGIPYQTFSTSVDKKLTISGHSFGLGGVILHDQSSSFNLSANEFLASISYSRIMRNQQITIGLQPGFVLKSYNMTGMTFGSQFNQSIQLFDETLPSLESGLSDRLKYFDLNAGIFWRTIIHNILPSAGISVTHLNMPYQKFSTSSTGTRLPMRLNLNSEVTVPVNSRINLRPCMIYSFTSGTNEFLLGSSGDYSLAMPNIPVRKLFAVTMLRMNPVRNMDAFILGGGAEFMQFNLGLIYDFNISSLHKATNFNGAFEVSLIYTGKKHARDNTSQPCYIMN